jgi:uncharacterized protein YjbJ (UPF0337 family)
MNWDTVKGDWKQFKGKVKEAWGKLTDDELDVIAGRRDQLVGAIQKSYGIARDEAEIQVRNFETSKFDGQLSSEPRPAAHRAAGRPGWRTRGTRPAHR